MTVGSRFRSIHGAISRWVSVF